MASGKKSQLHGPGVGWRVSFRAVTWSLGLWDPPLADSKGVSGVRKKDGGLGTHAEAGGIQWRRSVWKTRRAPVAPGLHGLISPSSDLTGREPQAEGASQGSTLQEAGTLEESTPEKPTGFNTVRRSYS